jgi:hypothetical protein
MVTNWNIKAVVVVELPSPNKSHSALPLPLIGIVVELWPPALATALPPLAPATILAAAVPPLAPVVPNLVPLVPLPGGAADPLPVEAEAAVSTL